MWEEGPAGLGIWHRVLQRYLVGWVHESLEVPLLDEALLPAVMSPLDKPVGEPQADLHLCLLSTHMSPKHSF